MKALRFIYSIILIVVIPLGPSLAISIATLGDNAALHYWAAFAQMQDSEISGQEAKELNAILDGTSAYDDLKYKDLVEKNRPALETMARGTTLAQCDWGLDNKLGEDIPVDYVRKSLTLGRLNVLYALHLLTASDKDRAVASLAAGLRFSQDVENGGSLFATVVAKDLLANHLTAIALALHEAGLSSAQKGVLRKAVAQLGPDALDWRSAIRRDLQTLSGRYSRDPEASAALTHIIPSYIAALDTPTKLPALEEMISAAPPRLTDLIPNPQRVLDEKQDLNSRLAQARLLFQ